MKRKSSSGSGFFTIRLVLGFLLCLAGCLLAFQASGAGSGSAPAVERTVAASETSPAVVAKAKPRESHLRKTARTFRGDLRSLPRVKPKEKERPEFEDPPLNPRRYVPPGGVTKKDRAAVPSVGPGINAPAPAPLHVFEGLDRSTWG